MARELSSWEKSRTEYRLESKKMNATYKYRCGRAIELAVSLNNWRDNYLEISLNEKHGGIDWRGDSGMLDLAEEILVNSEGLKENGRKELVRFIQEFQREKEMLELTGARMSEEFDITYKASGQEGHSAE